MTHKRFRFDRWLYLVRLHTTSKLIVITDNYDRSMPDM